MIEKLDECLLSKSASVQFEAWIYRNLGQFLSETTCYKKLAMKWFWETCNYTHQHQHFVTDPID